MLMLVPVCLLALVSLSSQQCLTPKDSVRNNNESAAKNLLQSELRFSTDLLHAVSIMHPQENVIFSPASVFKTMLLAYFFSANKTENTLKRALHLDVNEDKLEVMRAYTSQIYNEKLRSILSKSTLSSANRLYVDSSMGLRPCMETLFLEEIFRVNFKHDSTNALNTINNWVANKTKEVIKDLLNSDQVTPDTRMVLVNAAYFKGSWKYKFDAESTYQAHFTTSNGTVVRTTMMTSINEIKLIHDEGLDVVVVELPYSGDDISMLVVKPRNPSPSAVPQLVKKITVETLQGLVKRLNTTYADIRYVTIPKFTVEQELDLKKPWSASGNFPPSNYIPKTADYSVILMSIGFGDLFRGSADFSTLFVDSRNLSFCEATHKAKVRVNEEGTEAAAATDFSILARSYTIFNENFIADTPFLYILYDKSNNVIQFVGIYNHPEKNI